MRRLLGTFSQQEVHAAIKAGPGLWVMSLDPGKHLMLCRLEETPAWFLLRSERLIRCDIIPREFAYRRRSGGPFWSSYQSWEKLLLTGGRDGGRD